MKSLLKALLQTKEVVRVVIRVITIVIVRVVKVRFIVEKAVYVQDIKDKSFWEEHLFMKM